MSCIYTLDNKASIEQRTQVIKINKRDTCTIQKLYTYTKTVTNKRTKF